MYNIRNCIRQDQYLVVFSTSFPQTVEAMARKMVAAVALLAGAAQAAGLEDLVFDVTARLTRQPLLQPLVTHAAIER